LNQITRVDFGGDYENALHLVGGKNFQRAVDVIWDRSGSSQK
jgi:hypothetical protein